MQDGFCVIEGTTESGRKFRPSDWVERLASTHASFGADRRLVFSPELRPVLYNGTKSILVASRLQQTRPDVWEQVMGFAYGNQLRVHCEIDSTELALAS